MCKALALPGFASVHTNRLAPAQVKTIDKTKGFSLGLPELFPGRTARITFITEAGLYRLVMRSNKPEAAEFQDWVTDVVLPAIRKDGAYVSPSNVRLN